MCSGSAGFRTEHSPVLLLFLPPLPLGASAPAPLASAHNLTLMQSERPWALLRHLCSAPSAPGLQLPLRSLCLAPGSEFTHPNTPILPAPPPSALLLLLLLGCCTLSRSWCGLASRAKWDPVHNYVVRGHHDGSVSVSRHHVGSRSLCVWC